MICSWLPKVVCLKCGKYQHRRIDKYKHFIKYCKDWKCSGMLSSNSPTYSYRKLGFSTYSQYLKSKHWSDVKAAYQSSNLPKHCLACKNSNYHLHHLTYERIGNELLADLMPLCTGCHGKVHKYLKSAKDKDLCTQEMVLERVFQIKPEIDLPTCPPAPAPKQHGCTSKKAKFANRPKRSYVGLVFIKHTCHTCSKRKLMLSSQSVIENEYFSNSGIPWRCDKCRSPQDRNHINAKMMGK